MSVLSLFNLRSAVPGAVVIAGSFKPEGTGTPTTLEGRGFTVAYGGSAGKYVVTFGQKFPGVVAAFAQAGQDTLAETNKVNLRAHIISTSGSSPVDLSAKTLTIQVFDSGENTPDALDGDSDGSVVSFLVIFRNTTAG